MLREYGPFDLLVGGFHGNDFESDGSLRSYKAGTRFQMFVEILKAAAKQHKRVRLIGGKGGGCIQDYVFN